MANSDLAIFYTIRGNCLYLWAEEGYIRTLHDGSQLDVLKKSAFTKNLSVVVDTLSGDLFSVIWLDLKVPVVPYIFFSQRMGDWSPDES